MIKSFYTASLLMDVLSVFGELSEEVRSALSTPLTQQSDSQSLSWCACVCGWKQPWQSCLLQTEDGETLVDPPAQLKVLRKTANWSEQSRVLT